MNYWPAESGNLAECVEPLIAMVNDLTVTGARTARTMYGARGWVVHHNTDLWRASAPIDGPDWGMWPCGGAWLCLHLWDRYEFGGDPAGAGLSSGQAFRGLRHCSDRGRRHAWGDCERARREGEDRVVLSIDPYLAEGVTAQRNA